MNNSYCSIYIDNTEPIPDNIFKYIKLNYDSIFLCGNDMTTRFHTNIPYIYNQYIKYKSNIDIVFQNLCDIDKIDNMNHKIYYIFNNIKHNKDYKSIKELFLKIDSLLVVDHNLSSALIKDVFDFNGDIIYV
jgi:hypothetical protein